MFRSLSLGAMFIGFPSCLALYDRAIHNPDRPTDSFFEPVRDVFPKQFDTQQTQPLRAVAQALEQGNIRNVGPVRRLNAYNVSRNE